MDDTAHSMTREGPEEGSSPGAPVEESGDTSEEEDQEAYDEVIVVNRLGLHARPAARLVEAVLGFSCDIYIEKEGHRVNAKSIMGLLTLAAAQGSMLRVFCKGPRAEEALAVVRDVVESGFGEE